MRATVKLLLGIAVLAGCSSDPTTQPTVTPDLERGLSASVRQDLAKLRQVTAPFHEIDVANHAGWSAQITGCLVDPLGTGAMGFHYGRTEFINGSVAVEQPELLLYEPEKNGKLRLVAVEYIIPVSLWTAPNPPRLFDRDFHVIPAFQVWALHAWVWKDNPNGIFTDWNPKVSCENTTNVQAMRHH
jgi:hypothetical protein